MGLRMLQRMAIRTLDDQQTTRLTFLPLLTLLTLYKAFRACRDLDDQVASRDVKDRTQSIGSELQKKQAR